MADIDESEDSNNPEDINEYHESDDESSFGEEEEKVRVLSKKQKQTNAVKDLVRTAKHHFNNREFLNFQQDLKMLSDEIIKNKWTGDSYKMPKFYVKHMLEIYNTLQELDPNKEENQKEKRQLKLLKRNFQKDIYHFKQLQVFEANQDFWKDEESDLGQMDQADYEESDDDDDGPLYGIQDTAKTDDENDDDDDAENKAGDESNDEEEDDDEDESSWSSFDGGAGGQDDLNVDEEEEGDSDEEPPAEAAGAAAGGEAQQNDAFYAGFDEETLAKMRSRSFWVKKAKIKKKKPLTEKQKKRKAKTTKDKDKNDKEKEEEDDDTTTDKDKKADTDKAGKKTEPRKKEIHVKEWSVKRIREVFLDVLQSRGKTSVNRNQIVSQLEQLIEQCELHQAEQARLTVISVLIAFYFETAERKTAGMSGSRWRSTRTLVTQMLKSLSKHVDTLRVSNDADIRLILKDDDKKDGVETQDAANMAWMNAIQSVDESGASGIRPAAKTGSSSTLGGEQKAKKFGLDAFAVVQTESKKKNLDPKYQWIQGNLVSYIKKLTLQLWANLKSLDPKSEQYVKRKKNADLLVKTYKQAIHYFGKLGKKDVMAEMEVLWMAVIYDDYDEEMDELTLKDKPSKKDSDKKDESDSKEKKDDDEDEAKKTEDDSKKKEQKAQPTPKQKATPKIPSLSAQFRGQEIMNLPKSLVVSKAIFVFEHGSTRCQTQAMLYLIYNMAKHNKYELCRDLLLMSHLGSSSRIGSTNIEIQILYNRALARYAICSFCNGYWYSAMIILQELFASGRIKLLLAQGFFRAPQENASTEQLKQEQDQHARMLPHHFHINHDILEAAHLLSSLFIEIPNMISNSYNKSFIRNQHFRRVWHQYLRRDLRVPPENTKDYILTTGIMMQNGEFQTCKKIINKLRLWSELKHPRYVKKKVMSMLKRECLRCYLYRYGCVYETISIQRLSEMFELSPAHTKQYISKLIITAGNDSKFASLDELTQCVVMHQSPPMPIQRTALEYSDKLSFLIEQNEKLLGIYSRYSAFGGSKGGGKFGKAGGGKDGDKGKDGDGKQDKFNKSGGAGRGRGRGGGQRGGGQRGGGRGGAGGGRFNRSNQGGMMRPKIAVQQTQLRTFGRK
eukprot:CAMPEP_0197022996 /NCGR_PEP_ID=MMETSP1384-20130603/3780_1 /TAXON_ID=29189 /ORGANISM="Ammonia sp." /LENGTH=1120 /DNA_ID=CAMNT_0042451133 /DNA_START=59 /DNA_END=3421 /DNA_ORIENTATION=+